jgi:hypothetical protein
MCEEILRVATKHIEDNLLPLLQGVGIGLLVGSCFGWEFYRDEVDDLAEWAQAVGSVLAIVGAGWVARWQFRAAQSAKSDEILRQGLAVALTIRFEVLNLRATIERAILARSLELSEVAIPQAIAEQIDHMWMMGSAGGHLLKLIGLLKHIGWHREKWLTVDLTPEKLAEVLNGMVSNLSLALAICDRAFLEIGKMLEEEPTYR